MKIELNKDSNKQSQYKLYFWLVVSCMTTVEGQTPCKSHCGQNNFPQEQSGTYITKGGGSGGDLWQRVAVTWDYPGGTVKITKQCELAASWSIQGTKRHVEG